MSEIIQMYADENKTEKVYPITPSSAVTHGDKSLAEVLEETPKEAPKDNKQYARKNGDWAEVEGLTPDQKTAINDVKNKADKATTYTKTEVDGKVTVIQTVIGTLSALKTAVKDTIVNAINWLFEQVASLLDILGMYEDREPITLEADQIGKAIVPISAGSIYGKVDAYSGATISREYTLTRGDMLLMKTGRTSNGIFTVSQVVTNADGSKTYTKVMSLNELAEVPTDGYLRFLVMPSDMTIVVTYFPAEPSFSSTIRVKRCGAFASISTQVGNIYEDLKQNYAKKNGYYAGMRVGNGDALTPMGSKAPVYDEIITAGRMVNDAPDLIGSRTPSATNADSNIALRDMRGEVLGENQMVKNPDFSNGYTDWQKYDSNDTITMEDGVCHIVVHQANYGLGQEHVPVKQNHKFMCIACVDSKGKTVAIGGYGLRSSVQFDVTSYKAYNGYRGITHIDTRTGADGVGRPMVVSTIAGGTDIYIKSFAQLDLTTTFQTDRSFVNSLTNNTASALKVLHRLCFFAYTRNGSVATQLGDETLSLGASVIAKLGFQKPKLCTGTVGRFHLIDGNTGSIKQTLDVRAKKNTAWTSLLPILAEKGHATNLPFMQKPFEVSLDDDHAIKWNNNGCSVKCWIKEGTEASEGEVCVGNLILYPLAEEIRIDFEEEMNLNLVDVKPYDLYALDDMDGEPMYDINIEKLESGEYKTTVAPSATWVEQHHQLPVPIRSAIVGLGTQVNYDFVMNLYNEVQELKARN